MKSFYSWYRKHITGAIFTGLIRLVTVRTGSNRPARKSPVRIPRISPVKIVPVVEANGTETIISLATQLVILYVAFFGFAIVVYGLSVKLIGKQSPLKFLKAILPAALNAFGTCSSSATIPLSKQCMEEEMGVSNRSPASPFLLVLPLIWMLYLS